VETPVPARPTRRVPVPAIGLPTVETPAEKAPLATASAEEKPAVAGLAKDRFSSSASGAAFSRDELRSTGSSAAQTPAEPAVTSQKPASDLPVPPLVRQEPAVAVSLAASEPAAAAAPAEVTTVTPAITSSLTLRSDAPPADLATPLAVAVAALATEHRPAAGAPAADLMMPVASGATPAPVATSEQRVVPAAPAESLSEMTSEPSGAPETRTTHSSSDFAPAPTSAAAAKPEEGSATGGRPVIARRSVGPARIFLTREFSSLRIKSDLNPPKSSALAAARARDLSEKTPAAVVPPASGGRGETPAATEPVSQPGADLIPVGSTQPPAAETPAEPAPLPVSHEAPQPPVSETPAPPVEPAPESVAAAAHPAPEPVAPVPPVAAAHEPVSSPEMQEAPAPVVSPAIAEEHKDERPVVAEQEVPAAVGAEAEAQHEEPVPVEHAPESVPVPTLAPHPEEPAVTAQASLMEVPPIAPRPEFSTEKSSGELPAPIDIAPAPAMLAPVSTVETPVANLQPAPPEPVPTHVTTRHFASIMTNAPTSSGERATAQLTFSFEVASLQLTPFFKLGSVQLRPLSNVVSMQLAHGDGNASGAGANPLSANIAFEILTATTGGGNHGPVQSLVLKPLSEARAAATPQPKLAVNAVQLTHGAEAGPIQITPAHTSATSVQVLATFAIAGIDFTPLFEIGSMRLEPTSAHVLLKLSPGAGQASSLEHLPPSFELTEVQVTPEGQISVFTLVPRAS